MNLVGLARAKDRDVRSVETAIRSSLESASYEFPNGIRDVVIKPNLCYYWDYSTGQTTDSRVIAAMTNIIHENVSQRARISIVESDASAMKCRHAFKILGYTELAHRYGLKLVNLSEEKFRNVEVTVDGRILRLRLPECIEKSDLRINIPKIKYTIERLKITCALKNIFGCNPYEKKFKYHSHLEEVIVGLNKLMKFNLCILDGLIIYGASPRRLGLIMSGSDSVAFDSAAASIAGVNPRRIYCLRLAEKEGIGTISFRDMGFPIGYFKSNYPRRDFRQIVLAKAYSAVTTVGIGKRLGLS